MGLPSGFNWPYRRKNGFTIIEVLIVLAIAGLIMLIVFLAVPALQRNSRNTSYKHEARRILASVTEFGTVNSNALPSTSLDSCTGTGTSSPGCNTTSSPNDAMKIYQLAAPRNITALTIEAATGTTASSITSAVLRIGAICGTQGAGGAYSTTAGPARAIALIFSVEDSGGNPVAQCLAS